MTKARNEYIYQLTGKISKIQAKKASPKSRYAGQPYYDLLVNLKRPHQHIRTIQAFPEKLTDLTIWATIQRQEFAPQYLFHCRNVRGHYYLVNWEEVK
jgi:hypothetical protein